MAMTVARPPADTVLVAAAPFTITLFGPMRVLVEGKPLPHMHSRKALWLLALLALRPSRSVEREWLAGTLWPDADPVQALASLRPVLSELRKALGDEAVRLQSPNRNSLLLDLTGAEADVPTFDAAIASQKIPALERAVGLYQGPLLEGSGEEWAGQERNAREQDCLQALGTLAASALAAADYEAAAGYSRRAVGIAPGWEAARRGLMEALDKNGDSNGALQIYRDFIELLRSDPRAVPSEETSTLYARLRTETKQRATRPAGVVYPGITASRGAAEATPVVSGYLPHPLTRVVGREDERLAVAAKLQRSRLVTLTGPGGIGKTRLALAVAAEAAAHYADGVWLVSLEGLSSRAMVSRQIAIQFGLKEEVGRTCLATVADYLRTRRVLLVLDNCEHLLEESAQITGHLLRECAEVRILATSREALGITGETAWAVPALAVPDPLHLPTGQATLIRVLLGYESVQLFVERAQAVQGTFTLMDGNARAVAEICARLEGIPLAIELAAARARVLTPVQIAERLNDHLNLLSGGGRTAPPRQQTLRATLDWSYNLLSGPEQVLLSRLSVFAGGWSLSAAEGICGGDGIEAGHTLDLLMALIDKSLVVFEEKRFEEKKPGEQESGGRYRMLETIRQYAAEILHQSGAFNQIVNRHRDWALALAQEAAPQLNGAAQEEWLTRLDEEHDNLRAALAETALGPAGALAGLQLANTLFHFWRVRGYYSEGRGHLGRVLEHQDAQADTAERAKALNGLAMLATLQGDFGETQATYEQSLLIYRKLGDQKGIAASLNGLGNAVYWLGEYAAAWAAYEESLGISRDREDKRSVAGTLHNMGTMAYAEGDFTRSQAMYEESLGLLREQNDQFNIAVALHGLGNLAYSQEKYTAARASYEEGMQIARDLGARQLIAAMLEDFGNVDFSESEYASAHSLYEESLSIQQELGDRRGIAASQQNLAKVAFSQGAAVRANSLYRESLVTSRELGYQEGVAKGLKGLASVIGEQEQKSARLFGAAEALREKIGAPMLPNERLQYKMPLIEACAALGKVAFSAAWEEGRALTWEQAVEYALDEQREWKNA